MLKYNNTILNTYLKILYGHVKLGVILFSKTRNVLISMNIESKIEKPLDKSKTS